MSHSPFKIVPAFKDYMFDEVLGLGEAMLGFMGSQLSRRTQYVCMYVCTFMYLSCMNEIYNGWMLCRCCKMLKHYLQLSLGLEHGFGHFTPLDLSGCCLGDLGHNPDLQTDCQTLVLQII